MLSILNIISGIPNFSQSTNSNSYTPDIKDYPIHSDSTDIKSTIINRKIKEEYTGCKYMGFFFFFFFYFHTKIVYDKKRKNMTFKNMTAFRRTVSCNFE